MIYKRTNDVQKNKADYQGYGGVYIRFLLSKDDGDLRHAMRQYEIEPNGETAFHSHYEDHQWLFLEGEGAYVDADGNETCLQPGDVVYVGPDEEHQLKNVGDTVLKLICIIPIYPGGDGKGFAPRPEP